MTVSLCVVAYNEELFLPNLLKDFTKQTYPHNQIEIVLVDGNSTDRTKKIMSDFQQHAHDFLSVKIVDNPKKIQAAGWNLAIREATCDVVIRIDAHTHIPPEFTLKNMLLQKSGEYVTGGVRPCLIEHSTPWKQTLLDVENSLFGSSINKSRHSQKCSYVKTMFHAAYRREVFSKVGFFNERLLRTEDNEMHYRIRRAGYRFCFDPSIVSYQYARNSLKKMVRQKYSNGYWIGLTLGLCPACISIYHLVPFAFVLGIIVTSGLAFCGVWQLAALMWCLYGVFGIVEMIKTAANGKCSGWTVLMPVLFFLLHLSYGVGTGIGLTKIHLARNRQKE